MKKIAFLVESLFEINHFGVRNYFSTLKNILEENNIVDFISYRMTASGVKWYRVCVRDIKKAEESSTDDKKIEVSSKETIKYKHLQRYIEGITPKEKRYYYQYIGESLKNENYDICVITNPWCINENVKIDVPKIFGLVYDLIPNIYSLSKSQKDFNWGYLHNVGYKYYNKYCDKIFTINVAVAEQYKQLYPNVEKDKVLYFKPFVTSGFNNNIEVTNEKRENAIILAAPFDLRKGLLSMPKILNKLGKNLDKIYIFGVPRCEPKLFEEFFQKVSCSKVEYFPKVSQDKLISLYKKSKLLLFPSLDEGLGLPILEAQICGCRVVTTNKEPMNKLVLDGSYILTDDLDVDVKNIINILNDDQFNYESLSKIAKENFLYEKIEEEFLF